VNEIEVNVPIYSEPDEYELLVISNFSQKSPIEDIIDGSLYTASLIRGSSTILLRTYLLCSFFKHSGICGL
jgi:hypothetical protein